jgi:hypothetical protein
VGEVLVGEDGPQGLEEVQVDREKLPVPPAQGAEVEREPSRSARIQGRRR